MQSILEDSPLIKSKDSTSLISRVSWDWIEFESVDWIEEESPGSLLHEPADSVFGDDGFDELSFISQETPDELIFSWDCCWHFEELACTHKSKTWIYIHKTKTSLYSQQANWHWKIQHLIHTGYFS